MTVAKEMAAGGAAGLCQTVITTPMELLKIQLQLSAQQNAGRKASALLLASQLISTQGEKFLFIFFSYFYLNFNDISYIKEFLLYLYGR